MIHEIITCDKCNPQNREQGIIRHPAPNKGRGIFEGSGDAAQDAGWSIGYLKDYCPDCLGETEDREDA